MGKLWGPNPVTVRWLYEGIIELSISYINIFVIQGFFMTFPCHFQAGDPPKGTPGQVWTLGPSSQAPRALVWLIATKLLIYFELSISYVNTE